MKGLDMARGYFREECLPLLRRELPAVLPHLAAGLVGEGSECFGYDDMLSRDHDFGPAFCLWLPQRLMDEFSGPINGILEKMPGEYMGMKARPMSADRRVGLHSIESFYRGLIGCPGVPETGGQWLASPETGLAAAVNGEVFLDNPGEFSAVREGLLAHYPEDVRLWKLAKRCALAAQTGQYNYARSLSHGESLAAEVMKNRFIENAAGAVFLLQRRYMPFYKWSYRALRELSPTGRECERLMDMLSKSRGREAQEIIERISGHIIDGLRSQKLSGSSSDFLMDHCGEIILRISDEKLARCPISLDF